MNDKDKRIIALSGWTLQDDGSLSHYDGSVASGQAIDLVIADIRNPILPVDELKQRYHSAITKRNSNIEDYESGGMSELEGLIILAKIAGLDALVCLYEDRMDKQKAAKVPEAKTDD